MDTEAGPGASEVASGQATHDARELLGLSRPRLPAVSSQRICFVRAGQVWQRTREVPTTSNPGVPHGLPPTVSPIGPTVSLIPGWPCAAAQNPQVAIRVGPTRMVSVQLPVLHPESRISQLPGPSGRTPRSIPPSPTSGLQPYG